jgi:hypothetical protein
MKRSMFVAALGVVASFNTGCLEQAEGPEPLGEVSAALSGSVLFVTGSTSLNAADTAVRNRLSGLGFSVQVKSASSTTSGDAAGKALVVVSSTVSPTNVGTKFRDVTVPVVTWENQIYDDMQLTPSSSGNFGTRSSQRNLAITDPTHPLAAGLSGTVVATTSSTGFSWGRPVSTAVRIANLGTSPAEPAIFGYESGSALANGQPAKARRVGLFFGDTTASLLTTQGWALFDEAMEWAVGATTPTAPRLHVLYMVPSDKSVNQSYVANLELGARHLQGFFHDELGGKTFTLTNPIVTVLQSTHDTAWFQSGSSFHWTIVSEAQALTGVDVYPDPVDRWLVYVDVPSPCNNGTGATGSVATFPAQDLHGLSGLPVLNACDGSQDFSPRCRWVGGMGHEVGHILGLPHPTECEDSDPGSVCPDYSLMWFGYTTYPSTYFTPSNVATLSSHPVLSSQSLSNVPADCNQFAQ